MVQFYDPTQEAEIKRRRRMAEMLQQQGQPRQTEVVSGYAVPQSGLEHLVRGLSTGIGAYQGARADVMEQEQARQRQELLAQALSKLDTDQKGAGAMLAQDPSMMKAGLELITDANKTDRERIKAEQDYWNDERKFEREANLKREIAAMKGGLMVNPDTGELVPNPNVGPQKPLPVGALNLQDEITNAMANVGNLAYDASDMAARLRRGEIPLKPTGKLEAWGRNQFGISDEQSRAYGEYKTFVEGIRNAVLLLHKGVQTEGDAKRALNQLVSAGNDPKLAADALDKIARMNQRGLKLQEIRLSNLRANYGLPPLDTSKLSSSLSPATGNSDPLAAARDAIARGAPREAVIQRLQQNGIDATGL